MATNEASGPDGGTNNPALAWFAAVGAPAAVPVAFAVGIAFARLAPFAEFGAAAVSAPPAAGSVTEGWNAHAVPDSLRFGSAYSTTRSPAGTNALCSNARCVPPPADGTVSVTSG